jgi:TPR repeat protein
MNKARLACAALTVWAACVQAAPAPASAPAPAPALTAQADFDLGRSYRNGAGVQRDSAQALALIGRAARGGHAAAMFILSGMLAAGESTAPDAAGARRWLEAAADLELPEAMQQLALNLRDGAAGYARDEARAGQLMNELAHAMKHRAQR